MRKQVIFLLLLMMCTIPQVYAQERNAQGAGGEFAYEDCGCGYSINLTIFNGLNDQGNPGMYGGDEVADDKEEMPGAVTVANLNDTDGDGTIDKDDEDGIVASATGRDELDLMKLVIDVSGNVSSNCDKVVNLEITDNIKLWQDYKKLVAQNSLVFNINELPKTVFIEAIAVSDTLQDISIEAIVDGEEQDVVKATAIWVNKKAVYTPTGIREMNPTPTSLGIDETNLITLINYFGESIDNSRYGFGEFDPNDSYFAPELIKPRFGGRILFEFELIPNEIENELVNMGIVYDVTRRIARDNKFLKYISNNETNVTNTFPMVAEEPNDDSSNTDEDLIPIGKEIFSYDAPSEETNASARAFSVRKLDFIEFVRVSFGGSISGNSLIGSRCSDSLVWKLHYGLKTISSNSVDPYDGNYQILDKTTGGSEMVSLPRRLVGSGNGNINISVTGTNSIVTYLLEFASTGDKWFLRNKVNSSIIATSNTSSTGPWNLSSSSATIMIDQGNIPFSFGALFIFNIWNFPSVSNTLIAN